MTLRIDVTPEHIRRGQRNRYRACALALAFEHAGFASADVGVTSILLKDHLGGAYLIGMPDGARRFAADFDAGRPVAPFGSSVTLNRRPSPGLDHLPRPTDRQRLIPPSI